MCKTDSWSQKWLVNLQSHVLCSHLAVLINIYYSDYLFWSFVTMIAETLDSLYFSLYSVKVILWNGNQTWSVSLEGTVHPKNVILHYLSQPETLAYLKNPKWDFQKLKKKLFSMANKSEVSFWGELLSEISSYVPFLLFIRLIMEETDIFIRNDRWDFIWVYRLVF